MYGKFILKKADGSPIDPKAKYIILRYDAEANNSIYSRHAIIAYARTIKQEDPVFADDLLKEMDIEHFKYRDLLYDKLID